MLDIRSHIGSNMSQIERFTQTWGFQGFYWCCGLVFIETWYELKWVRLGDLVEIGKPGDIDSWDYIVWDEWETETEWEHKARYHLKSRNGWILLLEL